MYEVSQEFKTELTKRARIEHCRGSIGAATFTDANIISLSYSNRCSDTADVSLGSAYIGQIDAQFIGVEIERGDWRGLVITVEEGIELPGGTTEYIPVGVFTVASAEWTNNGVHIIANDNMSKLDKTVTASQIQGGSIYALALYACSSCNLTFGLTQEETEALPNGTRALGLYSENDIKTFRDFMSWLAQAAGGFATADREGNIIIKSFADCATVDTITGARIAGAVFSDYETLYDGISVVNIEDKTTSYYSGGTGDGAVINLGSNPFLQYGLPEEKEAIRQEIADVAVGIAYTPFKAAVLSHITYDLGDLLVQEGGSAGADPITTCIMQINWSFKQQLTLQGYGADPSLATGQSKTDKNLAGLMSKEKANTITYYDFTNTQNIPVPESTEEQPEELTIINIRFAAKETVPVEIWHEIKLDLDLHEDPAVIPVYDLEEPPEQIGTTTGDPEPARVIMRYYYDDILIGYSPEQTWGEDGPHMFVTNYFLPAVDNTAAHTWRVTLEILNGSSEIGVEEIHALLKGQNLVGEDGSWDGLIRAEDLLGYYDTKALTAREFTDEAEAKLVTILKAEANDIITRPSTKALTARQITEAVNITLRLVTDWVWMAGEANAGDMINNTLF